MLLSLVVFLPILFALIVGLMPKSQENLVRPIALAMAIFEFVLTLMIFTQFDSATTAVQLVEKYPWVQRFGISYHLGIDGISIWLVMMTSAFMPLVVLGSWSSITQHTRGFHSALFILQTAMLGTFLSLDAIFFYLFWELSLVPMYFIIGIWGGSRRIYATIKFFIFTMLGSVLMLMAMIYLMHETGAQLGAVSANLLDFYKLKIPFVSGYFFSTQSLLFWAFAFAFAIKVPMFPVHTWLPDAHVEAPTPGSVLLAAVMLKMGTYGFLRWVLPLFPDATEAYRNVFMVLGLIGIVYGALVAMVQTDIKKLVAYSSVSHMGYVVIGIFSLTSQGLTGSLYQMLNHGVSTGALFLLVGMIYERTHSREITKYGGLAGALPIYSTIFLVITLSSIAVPLTNGFIGEFLILLGTYKTAAWMGLIAVTGVVLGAVYMLWMYKRVFFGEEGELVADKHHPLTDLNLREILTLAPLVLLVFWMGLFPGQFIKYSEVSIKHLLNNRANYQISVNQQPEVSFADASKNLLPSLPTKETQ